MEDRKGGCLCGAVRYVLKGEPRVNTVCHCTHCQKQSGSLFSFNLIVRDTDYEQTGDTKVFIDSGDSGNPVYRHFCAHCGSPLYATIASAPGKIVLKAGTLDCLDGLSPQTEIYTDHASSWLPSIEGVKRFAKAP